MADSCVGVEDGVDADVGGASENEDDAALDDRGTGGGFGAMTVGVAVASEASA